MNNAVIKRAVAGLVGTWMLVSAMQDILAGRFNSHGTLIKQVDHPGEFWFWTIFELTVSIAGVYYAITGKEADKKR